MIYRHAKLMTSKGSGIDCTSTKCPVRKQSKAEVSNA
jgi:hypothetical protein